MRSSRIGIVGAGIAGLTAALALQRRGFKVTVLERAAELGEVGAGILVTPNSFRALLDLGVGDRVREDASIEPVGFYARYDSGEVYLETRSEDVIKSQGFPILQVHRADLHSCLREAVEANDADSLQPGRELTDVRQDESGVHIAFSTGGQLTCDVLIAADGMASRVRSIIFGDVAPRFTGQVAFRALIPIDAVPPVLVERGKTMYFGPQRMVLHYPLRRGTLMNLIGIGRTDSWEAEGWAIPSTPQEFLSHYADFYEPVRDLILAIPHGCVSKWGLRDREPLDACVKGLVVLIGDAAHPVTPFLGQGANIAMEDGLVLARAFDLSSSLPEALSRYERARFQRGIDVQLMSREQGEALQGASTEGGSAGKPAVHRGLFDYDPVRVDI